MTIYSILKVLHLFSIVLWMAGLIGIFRVFVLHGENKGNAAATGVLKDLAAWRYKVLALPGMLGTWLFALAMIGMNPAIMKGAGWMHAKIFFVLVLSGLMGFVGKTRKNYANDQISLDSGKANMFNTIVLVLVLVVLVLVLGKPF